MSTFLPVRVTDMGCVKSLALGPVRDPNPGPTPLTVAAYSGFGCEPPRAGLDRAALLSVQVCSCLSDR
jgi:hypothetical protein